MSENADQYALSQAADCVIAVEQAMRAADLWRVEPPTPAAMASRTPFCADTLTFSQWLQFIFIPRMRDLIEAGDPLPSASGIAVMAQTRLAADVPAEQRVIEALAVFDRLIKRDAQIGP